MKIKNVLILLILILTLSSCKTTETTIQLGNPSQITIEDDVLTITAIDHVTSYILEVNGEEIELNDLTYALSHGQYEVRYRGIYQDQTTAYSDMFYFTVIKLIDSSVINYSVYSDKDIKVCGMNEEIFAYETFVDEHKIDDSLMVIDDVLYLKHETIVDLISDKEDLQFDILTNLGVYSITIIKNQWQTPYVMSEEVISINDFDDIMFIFDLFESSFVALSTNLDVTNESLGLRFENDRVYMDKDSVEAQFEANETLTRVVIVYELYDESNDTTYLGYLHILRD